MRVAVNVNDESVKNKIGQKAWSALQEAAQEGKIDQPKLDDIAQQLVPKNYSAHRQRSQSNQFDWWAQLRGILSDWHSEENGLYKLTRLEAITTLIGILRSKDVNLNDVAHKLEQILNNPDPNMSSLPSKFVDKVGSKTEVKISNTSELKNAPQKKTSSKTCQFGYFIVDGNSVHLFHFTPKHWHSGFQNSILLENDNNETCEGFLAWKEEKSHFFLFKSKKACISFDDKVFKINYVNDLEEMKFSRQKKVEDITLSKSNPSWGIVSLITYANELDKCVKESNPDAFEHLLKHMSDDDVGKIDILSLLYYIFQHGQMKCLEALEKSKRIKVELISSFNQVSHYTI